MLLIKMDIKKYDVYTYILNTYLWLLRIRAK